jgi:hypothetical protein
MQGEIDSMGINCQAGCALTEKIYFAKRVKNMLQVCATLR